MATCVIYNPAARGQKAAHLRRELESLAGDHDGCALKPTYAAGSARVLAAQAAREGFATVVAAGGDGTIHEVLNGLAESPELLKKIRLGILPLGTANVFARELGLPLSLPEAWRIIQQGRELLVDLPQARHHPAYASAHDATTAFVQLGGAGLDSQAISLVDWSLKKQWGPLAYVIAGLKALVQPHPLIQVTSPEIQAQGELVLIGNGRFYGGSFPFFPRASLQDGVLDVLVYPRVDWESLMEVGYGWLTSQLHSAGGAIYFQTSQLTLASPERVLFELDGENIGPLPVTFSVLPRVLRVLVA